MTHVDHLIDGPLMAGRHHIILIIQEIRYTMRDLQYSTEFEVYVTPYNYVLSFTNVVYVFAGGGNVMLTGHFAPEARRRFGQLF